MPILPPPIQLQLISSMATKRLMAELALQFQRETGVHVDLLSLGGVDAVQRVCEGGCFDLVMLGNQAIARLMAGGHLQAGTQIDVVSSGVAVAVRAGAERPDIHSEAALRAAVAASRRVGYSTGPSGVQLALLFERWGMTAAMVGRIVTAPPGVPVGSLLARGDVDLAFQQLSELMHLPGIDLIGPLPPAVQITTTFSMAIPRTCQRQSAAEAFLRFVVRPEWDPLKRTHGMTPPGHT